MVVEERRISVHAAWIALIFRAAVASDEEVIDRRHDLFVFEDSAKRITSPCAVKYNQHTLYHAINSIKPANPQKPKCSEDH